MQPPHTLRKLSHVIRSRKDALYVTERTASVIPPDTSTPCAFRTNKRSLAE
ncbi:hypothetical protein HMPREF3039_02535 [Akkermansia sp. KLE1798]|nr:hypothetical protein HMPREF3039_02535 [Akkermansia sp. KLE1798]KZA05110.1 hypothetical protein HMPREF1326_01146 [Akkermansia sp. KLE1605]